MLVLAATLAGLGLLPRSAHGMYDPKHGRWLQRDPAGVRGDAPSAVLSPRLQYVDGASLCEYIRSRPTAYADYIGLGVYTIGDTWPAAHEAYETARVNKKTWNMFVREGWLDGRALQDAKHDAMLAIGQLYNGSFYASLVPGVTEYPQSRRMMKFYYENSGEMRDVDLRSMIREDEKARAHLIDEVSDAQSFIESECRNGDVAVFQTPVYSSIYHLGYLVGWSFGLGCLEVFLCILGVLCCS